MMNSVLELYAGACDMFVRPTRAEYSKEMLGPSEFTLNGTKMVREDLTVGYFLISNARKTSSINRIVFS